LAAATATGFAGAGEALTLQRARALTLSRSATLRSALFAVDAASLAAQAQGYAALPSLAVSAGVAYGYPPTAASDQTGNSLDASAAISATMTVFDGGKTSALVEEYGVATEAARESLRSARVSLIGQADAAFFAVLEAQASVDAAASDLKAAESRQAVARAKIEAGSLSESAYLQSEADTAGYVTTLVLARKTLSSAKARMASLTGLPATTDLAQIDFSSYAGLLAKLSALDEAGIDALANEVLALAKANSPALAGYSLSSRQAQLAEAVARKSYMPTVAAGFSQGFSQGLGHGSASSPSFPGSVSLTASMSLDPWSAKNAVDSASVASARAILGASQGETDLELSLVQALYEWISSAGSIGSAAKALEYARSNYESVLERFELSSATTSDLSTAEALVSADETALIAARYGFLSNLSILGGLAGLEDAAELAALVR
jgi:outer membrane protein